MDFNEKLELAGGAMGLYARGLDRWDVPAVVVLQEIFGVNRNIRHTVDGLSEYVFRAVAPDLYWRQSHGIELNPDDSDAHPKAMQHAQVYGKQLDVAMSDLASLIAHLRTRHRKVAVLGYCLGGRMAFLSWLRLDADAVVSYYGVGLDLLLGEVDKQSTPLLMHMGASDHLNPPDVQGAIADALEGYAGVEIHTYPGVGHAFSRREGKSYVPEAAQSADARTLQFLRTHLSATK